MRSARLIFRNLGYFWRVNLAVAAGVAVAAAVLSGALLVGASVRGSLRTLVIERLGATDLVASSQGFFREAWASDVRGAAAFKDEFADAAPLIVLEGVVTHEGSGRRAGGVQVYGVDDRFWTFHQRAGLGTDAAPPSGSSGSSASPIAIGPREAWLSPALARELGASGSTPVLLKVPKPSAVPGETLHGVRDDAGRTIRLTARGALERERLGEFALRPQQGDVRALFVPLRRLQTDLQQPDRVNAMIVADRRAAASAADAREREAALGRALRSSMALADLGVTVRELPDQRQLTVERDTLLIADPMVDAVQTTAARAGLASQPVLTYLATSIEAGGKTIPYSLVTATDLAQVSGAASTGTPGAASGAAQGAAAPTTPSPIVLNAWAAGDLGARVGDRVTLRYDVWLDDGRLASRSSDFTLAAITPIAGLAADRNLAPQFPGITDSPSLGDWDPPFPIDLSRVRRADEDYWRDYRTTPKAFVPLASGQAMWGVRFGRVTAIRLTPAAGADLGSSRVAVDRALRESLDPASAGIIVRAVRAQGLAASTGATDFGEYFTYFSFFIVVSALLLTTLFFKLGIEQRVREVGLLHALGFTTREIGALLAAEGMLVAATGAVVGCLGGVAYAALMMVGLRTWWVDAVGTTSLALVVTPGPLVIGAAGAIAAALACILWTLRSLSALTPRRLLVGGIDDERSQVPGATSALGRYRWAVLAALSGAACLAAAAAGQLDQTGGFFGAGFLLLAASVLAASARLRTTDRSPVTGEGAFAVSRLGWRSAAARPGRTTMCLALIAAAAFIIVSVGAFRRDASPDVTDRRSGSGGFALIAETLLPLHHNPNTAEGREALALPPPEDADLDRTSFTRFRLRPGDDASCLNLYEPRQPRILGATAEFITSGRFAFQRSLAQTDEQRANPWLLLDADDGGPIPVIGDANSLTYVLHRSVGDEFEIDAGDGRPLALRVVAALADSVLQGELIMSERRFVRAFPGSDGYRVFLIDAPADRADTVTAALERRLGDYGFDAASVADRIASFHRVENTYLSTFQFLGGLGLLLGTVGLAAVLVRNVIERRRELALLRAVGYRPGDIATMVLAENALVMIWGLTAGAASAVLAIAPALAARGGGSSFASMAALLAAVIVTGVATSALATAVALREPLIPALRAE